ncbi:hypothetical protein HanPI659440_Chr16g0653551 [Helianthus annuus]|nr:hypothetical protein HanPI659440_Chr16g0653551 [Helianthus annuus]
MSWCFKAVTASGTGRLEHTSSLLRRISLAASGVDATIVVMLPSWMVISGPCFFARVARVLCGFGPSN